MRAGAVTRKRVVTAATLMAVVIALATAGPTPAVPTSVAVASGVLGVVGPAVTNFAVVTLDGTPQAAEARLEPFAVTDARGIGQGWSLNLQATPLRE